MTCRSSRRHSGRSFRRTRSSSTGDPILALAAVDETTAADALEKIKKIELEQLPHVLDRLTVSIRADRNARSNGNVAAVEINLQTVKQRAGRGDFGDDSKLPMGKPAQKSRTYGDLDAAFKASKLVIEESFVTAGYSHHSTGAAHRHGLLAGRQVLPRRLQPEPHGR